MPDDRPTMTIAPVGSATDILSRQRTTVTLSVKSELDSFLGEDFGLVSPSGTYYSEGEIEAELDRQLDEADMAIIRDRESNAAFEAAKDRMLGRAKKHDALRKEAALLLSWLNANGCLVPGALPRALEAVRGLKHRL